MKSILCFLTLLLCPYLMSGQKKFEVTFVLPDSTAAKKLSFFYYDFNERVVLPVSPSYHDNKATISHTYNTVYAQIVVQYGNEFSDYPLRIFTTEKPAIVNIPGPIDEKDPFKNYTLVNAQDTKKEFTGEQEYIKAAQKTYRNMYDSLSATWNPSDSLSYFNMKELQRAVDYKRLEYLSRSPHTYYAFNSFGKNAIDQLPPDTLLKHFATFPAAFRNSKEGASIRQYIMERRMLDKQHKAISFTVNDIDNNKVTLKDLYDKKYVLLVFWGTWCSPCLEEIPILKEIREQYSQAQLEIVSVAVGSDSAKVRSLIKEQQMNWVHILNHKELAALYKIHGYPETVLIDKQGNIIYRYSNYPDLHMAHLKRLLEFGIAKGWPR